MNPLSKEELRKMLYEILSEEQKKRFEKELEIDLSHSVKDVARFRVNVYRQERGDSAAFRIIPSDCPTLAQLNMPAILAEMALKEKGLILVTGPTGSGKSTTLAAMVNHINENKTSHVITIEDPIELSRLQELSRPPESWEHTHSFSAREVLGGPGCDPGGEMQTRTTSLPSRR
jgi:twitching motility protein PilT